MTAILIWFSGFFTGALSVVLLAVYLKEIADKEEDEEDEEDYDPWNLKY